MRRVGYTTQPDQTICFGITHLPASHTVTSYAILFLMGSRMVIDVVWATFKDGERYLAGHCAANKESRMVAFGSSLMSQALGSEG